MNKDKHDIKSTKNVSSHELINVTQVEKDFTQYLDWFYRDECSDEIEHVIDICDRQPTHDFEKAWCDIEDQELVWVFLDLFNFDLRSMLVALVLQRREEEKEHAKEMMDRMRGLHNA